MYNKGEETAPIFFLPLSSTLGPVRQGKLLNGTSTYVMCRVLQSPDGALQLRCLNAVQGLAGACRSV